MARVDVDASDERNAIAQLKRGEIAGLESLVRAHYLSAVRAAYLVTRDRARAEDIVQTAFIRAYERIGQFDAARPFAPWFMRSVVNSALSETRRAGRFMPLAPDAAELEPPDPQPGPIDALEHAETAAELRAALDQLAPEQRAAVVLRYYLELPDAEAAQRLGIPPATVRWRLHAARKRLRGLLRPTPDAAFRPAGRSETAIDALDVDESCPR
jgi:RNA polymerase sigma-70 factor (ECF subfamily)